MEVFFKKIINLLTTYLNLKLLFKKLLRLWNHYINDLLIKHYIIALISLFTLFFSPRLFPKIIRLAYSFSIRRNIPIPIGNERIMESSDVYDDFLVQISGIHKMQEINIVMPGESVKRYQESINYNLPTFYVNFYGDHSSKIKDSKNSINITADERVYEILKKETDKPIIRLSRDKLKSRLQPYKGRSTIYSKELLDTFISPLIDLEEIQMGSGLVTIIALKKITNKMNIYGWDNYLTKDIGEMSLIQYIYFLFKIPKSPYYRRLYLMTEKVINLVYAYRLASSSGIKIYSNLSGILDRRDLYLKYKSFIYK